MKKVIKVIVLLAYLVLFSINAYASGNINVSIGQKFLESDWEPVDNQFEFGIESDFKQLEWPVSAVLGYSYSTDDDTVEGVDVSGNTTEIFAGIKKIWNQPSNLHTFISGGFCIVNTEASFNVSGVKVSDSDSGTGLWLSGGAYLTLEEHYNIGTQIKYTHANATNIFDVNAKASGFHYGLLAGYSF